MVCLIKDKYKSELKEYASILGSEEAAYYVLAMNNGYTLDYTPEGKRSELYHALLHKYDGDVNQSIIDKCLAFTPQFISEHGDYTMGQFDGPVDINGEPSIKTLNGGPLCDSSSIRDILFESGDQEVENQRLISVLDKLETNNFLIRDFTIRDMIDYNRSVWVNQQISRYAEDHPDANIVDTALQKNNLEIQWNKEKLEKLMGDRQKKLAEVFDLERVDNEDGTYYYKTKENSRKNKLRVHFVNSLRREDWKDEDGNWHKGLFRSADGQDAFTNLILISLNDGDPTTFVHELAHHYIQTFWESDIVQRALSYIDHGELDLVRRFNKDPRILEEKLVKEITKKVLQNDVNSWVSKFWFKFANMVKDTLGLNLLDYNKKQNIIDQITMYMSINQDLSDNKAREVIYTYLKGIRYSGSASDIANEIYSKVLKSLIRKRDAIKAKTLKDNSALAKIEYDIEEFKSIDYTTQAFTDYMIDLTAQAKRDLIILSTKLLQYDLYPEQLYNTPASELVTAQTDILEYYATIFGSQSTEIQALINSRINPELSDQIESIRSLLSSVSGSFNSITKKYVYNIIETKADQLVTTGDKDLWIANAKYWMQSQVDHGSLMFGEKALGIASQSRSPIIRLVEYMTTENVNFVRTETLPVLHKLWDLYKKCNFPMSFHNAMRMFYELDENGDPTGYWIRPLNYGRMFRDKDKLILDLLDKPKYKGKVERDDYGNFIFKDESIKNDFLDEKDDLEDTISNKRYTAQYYKDRRRFLSQETINAQSRLQRQIDILIQKCTDNTTGIPEIHKLTQSERRQLDKLYKEKENLANPYYILYSPDGKIRSFKPKPEGSTDLKIANELIAWKIHLTDKVKYNTNNAKFDSHRNYLINKYGADSNAVKWFDWYYSSVQLSPDFYNRKNEIMRYHFGENELPENIQELYRRKSVILNAVRDKHGYYQPHLERLNDEAWAELKRIDQEIANYYQANPVEKQSGEDEEIETISSKQLVQRYVNDKLTKQKYLLYLKDITPENIFYDKYFYDDGGTLKCLSAFKYEKPFDEDYIQTLPTGMYSSIDPESFYANPDYDTSDPSYIQPKKELYENPEFKKLTGAKLTFYNYVLEVMQEANANIPNYIDTRSYRTPGMSEKSSHLLFRKSGNFFKNCWHYFKERYTDVDDTDTDYNEEVAVKPNGERVYTIPLRWIRRLDDPANTTTDLIGSVTKYYEMSLNYKVMQELAPTIELFKTTMVGGTAASDRPDRRNSQIERLQKYMEMYIYGKLRKGFEDEDKKMSRAWRAVNVLLDKLARNSYLKMMSHNYRGILKNMFDSGMSTIVELSAGKYFEPEDFAFASKICGTEVFSGIASINTPNNKSLVSAAMQYNGQSGTIAELASDLRDIAARRFVSRFYAMGEYTFVDYTIKGWLTPAVYHNHRLIDNFNARAITIDGKKHFLTKKEAERNDLLNEWQTSTEYRKEYMNKQQAIYNYISAGRKGSEGLKAWKNQNNTLWDAYELDEYGNFSLKAEYVDRVRPMIYSTGKRSRMTEDRVAGVMRERFAVIAGMLPQSNKGGFLQTPLGVFVFLLRGWLVTFAWDCFRTGSDFSKQLRKSDINKENTSDQTQVVAEDIDFYQQMFEFETGQAGKGWLMGQGRVWKKLFMNGVYRLLHDLFRMNKVTKRYNMANRKLSTTERQQLAKFTQYILMAILCIIGSNIFGRLLEDDPDNLLWNFGYSESLALLPERTTQLNPLTVLDLIRNVTAAQSYIDDVDKVVSIPADWYKAASFGYNWIFGDAEWQEDQDQVIYTGSYAKLTKWQRDALKSSSIIAPGLGLNNIAKNIRPEAHKAYQTWLFGQQPVSWLSDLGLVYKVQKKQSKKAKDEDGFVELY